MLEKPDLADERIVASIEHEFGLGVDKIAFLPLGADLNTAVYRVTTTNATHYFLKLRRGSVQTASVALPNYLGEQGLKQVIPSLTTNAGQLWAKLDLFKVILYPYVEGHNGYEVKLTRDQWVEFGAALKRFHEANVPPDITGGIRHETFSPEWREIVRSHLARIDAQTVDDPLAAEMAAFLIARREETLELVRRAESLGRALQAHPPEFILCHGDIHGWNLLLDPAGNLYIVDWDTLIFAPKERDLMFIGAGLGDSGYTPREEETMFYQGYGQTEVNPLALAYYRHERIIEDIAIFCDQVLLSGEGGEDRKQALEYLKSNYRPGGTIDVAMHSDRAFKADH